MRSDITAGFQTKAVSQFFFTSPQHMWCRVTPTVSANPSHLSDEALQFL